MYAVELEDVLLDVELESDFEVSDSESGSLPSLPPPPELPKIPGGQKGQSGLHQRIPR